MATADTDNRSVAYLQRRVGEWADYNFGSNRTTTYRSLYGIIEEFGELVHSQLKMEQGIRGAKEEHMTKIRDAVGDLVFYLMDYLHMMGEEVDFDWPSETEDGGEGTTFDVISLILYEVNSLVQEHSFRQTYKETKWHAELIMIRLGVYCVRSGIDMREAVWTTAEEVFQRDWIKFPKNGRTE